MDAELLVPSRKRPEGDHHQPKAEAFYPEKRKLRDTQFDSEKIEKQIFSHSILEPEIAVKNGLIDGIMNLDDMLSNYA